MAWLQTGRFRPAQGPHGSPLGPVLLRGGCASPQTGPCLPPGPGILTSHGHTLPANGEMNGSHGSQPMVSGSHCTPPPSYHADPSLVRYVGHCWALTLTHWPCPFVAPGPRAWAWAGLCVPPAVRVSVPLPCGQRQRQRTVGCESPTKARVPLEAVPQGSTAMTRWPRGRVAGGVPRSRLEGAVPTQPGGFSLQFSHRPGLSQLHRAFHLPRRAQHLPAAEPDAGGTARPPGRGLSPPSGVGSGQFLFFKCGEGGCEIWKTFSPSPSISPPLPLAEVHSGA